MGDAFRFRKVRLGLYVVVVIPLGMILSLAAFLIAWNLEEKNLAVKFKMDAYDIVSSLRRNLKGSLYDLESIASLYAVSPRVRRHDFREFVKPYLSRNLAIQALEWIPRLPESKRAAYEQSARQDGFPNFQITEKNSQGHLVRAGSRQEYFPVYYVEPHQGNEVALGYDLASDPTRLKALTLARDLGEAMATAPIRLVQENASQQGFLIYWPLYLRDAPLDSLEARRANFTGFALGVFRIGNIVENALKYLESRGHEVFLFDRSAPPGNQLLYSHDSGSKEAPVDPKLDQKMAPQGSPLHYAATFDLAGRRWQVLVKPGSDFLKEGRTWQPWGVLLGGLLFVFLLSVYLIHRRGSEELLRGSERFLADIFASIQDGINIMDTDYNIIRVNPTLERWYAHALPLVGKKCYAVFHGRREPCEICPYRQTLKTGKAAYQISPRKGKDGEEAGWIEIFTFPLTDMATGKVKGVVAYIRDFTERKQAEEAFQERERFLTSIFASIQDGISVLDNEFNIVRVNPAMERAYAQAMPLVGKKCYEAYHGRREPCEICPTRSTLETGLAAREMVMEKGAGGEIIKYVDLYTFPLLDMSSGQMKGVVEYVRDVTEHKQAEEALRQSEEQLLQAQKMEAVGRLAGGVAHDFNNILTGITGYSELLLMSLKGQDSLRHDVEEIKNAAERAASLTRQLLAFSRKQVLQLQPLNLNVVVANMDKMLQRVIGEDIDLVTMLAPELGTVKADPGQIEQVIMNLAVNARDAMPRGGKLTIETADVHLDEGYARSHEEVQPGPYVMLAISDTGIGMDGEAQSRIFEPFYTTKEQGQGTGLGLSTVYGIIKQSGGHIWVYSEPGRGTTFKIYLPLMEGAAAAATHPSLTPAKSFQGTETILLVEDEEMVRQVTRRILEKNGYTVLEAGRGQQALDINDRHPGAIQLLLTDVVMPGMSGRELVDRLSPQHPEMKVLYMSGHTENAIVHHGVLDPGVAFLQKPFRHEVLVRKVREVLDTPPPGPAKRSGPGPEVTAGGPPGGG